MRNRKLRRERRIFEYVEPSVADLIEDSFTLPIKEKRRKQERWLDFLLGANDGNISEERVLDFYRILREEAEKA